METLAVDFSKNNKEFELLLLKIFGEKVQDKFLESRKFNGDIVNIVVTILIPVTVPFLAVLFQNYLVKDDETIETEKTVKFTHNNEIYLLKNYNIQEVSELLKELKNNSEINGK